jgi:hypothetical protein
MFMKTFEEKWTAWVDDQLTGKELADFEASLPDRTAAEAEKRSAKKLSAFLKRELTAQTLHNEDFFSHQLRERLEHDMAEPADRGEESEFSTWWTIRRLFWAGATSLALFVAIAVFVMREEEPAEQSQYLTKILQTKVDPAVSPDATTTIFEDNEDRVTVLWTEGLKSLPADYAAK